MKRCLVFVVAVSIWILTVGAVPQGENTCQGVVKHPVKVKVNVTEPVTFRTYTWCLRVPPRCSKYIVQMRERVKEQIEMHNRTITVCCRGFVEMESKCVPACPPKTECPNMHCNRTNHCYCSPGYSGVFCNDPCPKGSWGKDCKKPCDCPDGFTCHHLTGDCMLDDKPSVKTTVRRAFTHISLESVPTTIRSIPTTTVHHTSSTPKIKITTVSTSHLTFPTTSNPIRKETVEPLIPTSQIENVKLLAADKFIPSSTKQPFTATDEPVVTLATTTTKPTPTTASTTTPVSTTVATTTTHVKPTTTLTTPNIAPHNADDKESPVSVPPKIIATPSTFSPLTSTSATSTFKHIYTIIPSTTKPTIPYWREPITVLPKLYSTVGSFSSTKKPSLKSLDGVEEESTSLSGHVTVPSKTVYQDVLSTQSLNVMNYANKKALTPDHQFINKSSGKVPESFITISRPGERTSSAKTDIDNHSEELTSSTPFSSTPLPNLQDFMFKYSTVRTQTKPDHIKDGDKIIPPELSTTFHSFPKLYGSLKESPLSGDDTKLEVSTVAPFGHFNNIHVTSAPESQIVPMQTPNRIWDLFIPSPGSTKSQGSLTVPFSPYIPVTTVNVIGPTTEIPKESDPELKFFKPSQGVDNFGSYSEIDSQSFTPLVPKTSLAHTFLHSFSDSAEMVTVSPELKISTLPTTMYFSHSVSRKKPYFIGGDFGLLSLITNKKENMQSTTPFTFTNNAQKKDRINLKDAKLSFMEELPEEYTQASTKANTFIPPLNQFSDEVSDNPNYYKVTPPLKNTNKGLEKFIETDSEVNLSPEDMQSHSSTQSMLGVPDSGQEYLKPTLHQFSKKSKDSVFKNVELSTAEPVNIFKESKFISILRPKTKSKFETSLDTRIPTIQKTEMQGTEFSTVSDFISRTYPHLPVTSAEVSANSPTNSLDDNDAYFENKYGITLNSKRKSNVIATTPLTPRDVHPVVNGNMLEELSNYLPSNGDKPSTYFHFEPQNKFVIPTEEYLTTPPSQSNRLPSDKDFLNLTYILNSINDFTADSKRDMKQSKSSIYSNPVKSKHSDNPTIDLIVSSSYEPSTEFYMPVTPPSRSYQKQENQRKEKNRSDSKIIHLNITSPISFHNPTTNFIHKISPKHNPLATSSFLGEHKNTSPIDGKITTVSIISTSPLIKYQAKRSTKEYLEKTENAFTLSDTPYSLNRKMNVDPLKRITETYTTRSYNEISTTAPITTEYQSDEISKKPFRRKDGALLDKIEDMSLNMTVALAARASETDASSYLSTGVIASLSCILLTGFIISAVIFALFYCRKEKPVPMESCIMAYEQSNPDPAAIYSVPRPSLLPEIFFCPSFSHHYAAQINKELRELSYGATKNENSEPVYTEISSEVTSA